MQRVASLDGRQHRRQANPTDQHARAEMKISVLLLEFQFGTEIYEFETYTKKKFGVSAV